MEKLKNKKIFLGKFSKEVQKIALSLGYVWSWEKTRIIKDTYEPFLYFSSDGIISEGHNLNIFNSHEFEEISVEEILGIEVELTFKPDQLVLVRDKRENVWKLDRYSHYEPNDEFGYCHVCFGNRYKYCISYKGNGHLLGVMGPSNN